VQAADSPPPAQPAGAPAPVAKVEVKGKAEDYDARRDDTASKTVINQEEILKYGDTNVFEVLKRAPGVTVVGNSIRMRGLGNGYTQVLVNGERPPPGFSMDALTPDQIERIEIIRAATAEHSMQAIAGTVNIVLKKVVAKPQRDVRAFISRSEQERNAFVVGTLADRKGGLSYYLNGMLGRSLRKNRSHGTDQFTAPDGSVIQLRDIATRSDSDFNAAGFNPRLNWKLSDDHQLNFNAFLQASRSDNSSARTHTNRIGSFPQPDYVDHAGSGSFSGRFGGMEANWVAKLGGGKLDAKVNLSTGRMNNDNGTLYSTAGQATRLQRDQYNLSRFRNIGSTGKYTRSLFEGHALAAGWELSQQDSEDGTRRVEGLVATAPRDFFEYYNPRVRRLAAYAQDEWNITRHWSMYLGARWEGIRTESEGSGVLSTESNSHVLSPVAQTLYKFPDKSGRQLRMALTRTYKAPETRQLSARRFDSALNTRFTPDQSGNPDLRPELANGVDLTYEHFFAPGAVFSFGGSVRSIRDHIRSELGQDSQGLWVIRPVNEGKAQVRTLDLELKFPLKAVLKDEKAMPLDFRFNVNRNWSKVESVPGPDNRLDQQTPLSATLGIDYKTDRFSAGASYAFRKGGLVRISEQQYRLQRQHRDVEGYALYKIRKGLDLRVTVNNALGEDNLEYSRYVDLNGSSENWMRTFASPMLRMNLEMKF
jgi:outer membrane receptor for ferrienterochelin and colicin